MSWHTINGDDHVERPHLADTSRMPESTLWTTVTVCEWCGQAFGAPADAAGQQLMCGAAHGHWESQA